MKILAIAAAAVLSASALQASDFEIRVSDLKNIPVPAPTLAPITAAPLGSWNTVDTSVKQFFYSWKQGKPVSGTMLIQTNASCAKPNAGAPRHDIMVDIPNSGLTVSFPSSNGVPVVLNFPGGVTVTIPGGLVVTIPGNPPLDLSNSGNETVVSIPGGPSVGGLVVSVPGTSLPTVTFPAGPISRNPRVRVACGVNTLNPNVVNKGSQRSTPIENARYRAEGGKLNISGSALKKQVAGDVQNAQISGTVGGVNCAGQSTVCYGKFRVAGGSLLLDVSIDQDQDGNPEKTVRNVRVGSVAQGEAAFSVPVRPVFVEDRYSFAEHLMGIKDAEFVAITVEVSAD